MRNVLVLLVMVIFVSALSSAQYYGGSVNSQAQPLYMPDHPAHAGHGDLRPETTLLSNGGITMAQGDRPASDFPTEMGVSLGRAARELRKEHDKLSRDDRAKFVYTN